MSDTHLTMTMNMMPSLEVANLDRILAGIRGGKDGY